MDELVEIIVSCDKASAAIMYIICNTVIAFFRKTFISIFYEHFKAVVEVVFPPFALSATFFLHSFP